MSLRRPFRSAFLTLPLLAVLNKPLTAQAGRDSLAAGRRAYERADFSTAVRLFPIGLVARVGARDTAWSSGVHMLLDALISLGDSAGAGLWARWAARVATDLRPDSNAYPPAVARRIGAARTELGPGSPDDSMATTTYQRAGDPGSGRGALRLAGGTASLLAVLEGVGTMLPGESRVLPAGSYAIRVAADGYAPLQLTREVLPGFVTVVEARLRRAAERAAEAPGTAIRGPAQASGGSTSCSATGEAGRVLCWGDNRMGQRGDGSVDTTRGIATVAADSPLVALTVGAHHACALSASGRAYCWGQGTSGQLGNGLTANSPTPVPVQATQSFIGIAAGASHTCALTGGGGGGGGGAGAVFCWGANRDGQLGNRSTSGSAVPVAVSAPPGTSFTAVTAGGNHSCALTAAGAAWCWGENTSGQVGNGSASSASAPVLVVGGLTMRAIAAGQYHTCAVTAAGTAWCWGANYSGQLGTGGAGALSLRPVLVAGDFTTFTTIAAGDAHTCAQTRDGATYCWGSGRTGQLGNGQSADSPRPALVVGGHTFRWFSLGLAHTCALTAEGVTMCWGDNAAGQIGLAGAGPTVPTPVLLRPSLRAASGAPVTALREQFSDGDWRSDPPWQADSVPGSRVAVSEGALAIERGGARRASAAAGLSLPLRVPVTRETTLQFDLRLDRGRGTSEGGCGLNCGEWPAMVRLRVRNTDLTDSELWLVYGDAGTVSGRTLGNVVLVARGDTPRGTWLRNQRFALRDYLPRADTVLQISLGGIGGSFAAQYDNIILPAPLPVAVVMDPDSARLTSASPRLRFTATARDAAGQPLSWIGMTWTSSDTSVARVDSTGLVTGLRGGTALIRARAGALSDSARVRVLLPAPRQPPARRP